MPNRPFDLFAEFWRVKLSEAVHKVTSEQLQAR